MLSMNVSIYYRVNTWVLEVSCPNDMGKTYHFLKDGFASAQAAKLFLYNNIGTFVVHMGQPS